MVASVALQMYFVHPSSGGCQVLYPYITLLVAPHRLKQLPAFGPRLLLEAQSAAIQRCFWWLANVEMANQP